MLTCPICGQPSSAAGGLAFCAAHAMFALLWSAVRAGKWSDWPDGWWMSHATMQTWERLEQKHRPDWRPQVAAINAGARFWLDGGAHSDNAA